jgi:hypothetical protein
MELNNEIEKLRADLASAIEALKPLVNYERWMDDWGDGAKVSMFRQHTYGDLRRAAAEIAKHKEPT